ncbi:MAG: sensor histidine kinase [Bacillota bacterium]
MEGAVRSFLSHNWFLVFFIYGLAFFLMGFSIAFHVRRPSTFHLGRHLPFLAGFGLIHGIAEWAYIFFPPSLEVGGWETLRGAVLNGSHAILIAVSFAFLFTFGSTLLVSIRGWPRWLRWLPASLFGLWIWIFIFRYPTDSTPPAEWLGVAEIASRYLLAFPGAILTSLGFYFQRHEIRELKYPPLERSLFGASLIFAFYAFAGGLVVPPASFPLASFLNTSLVLNLGLPVQLLRATAGVFMVYFVIRSLDLYEIENRNRLEAFQQRELIWLEKERIRRDLHDGAIQAIYGLALGLDYALSLLKKDSDACASRLKELRGRADAIISELRHYLQELKFSSSLPENPVVIIEDLLADFTATTRLIPDFRRRGSQKKTMTATQREHFYHMAAEILSNIRRHASAKRVEVELDSGPIGLRLAIRDNGVGFVPGNISSRGLGILNLRERAALAGGWVDIKSVPGQGTEVVLWLPYEVLAGGSNLDHQGYVGG